MDAPYRYCPVCAGRLNTRVLKTGDRERLVCSACGYVLYLDPKVAVGTIISSGNGQIVLVKRAIEPGLGLWVFPGGYVDRGETPQVAAVREAREECGLEVRLDALVNLYAYPGRTPIIIVYAATMTGGALCVDDEGSEAGLFGEADVPWRELAFPSTRDALRDYYAGIRHPKL
ncbi:MAG TPA: NUDIX hydrolase [Vicinamibacterales bacterium]|nr:NUDIX hydrolase [Vicinamibacterales bacterium]